VTDFNRELDALLARQLAKRDWKAGWCERHGHHCPMLEVSRTAARVFGAMTMVTAEEKRTLCTPCGKEEPTE
jgi:hypothetical protein